MEVLHPHCAGLDVHKDSVVACVRHMVDGDVKREVRSFKTTTKGLMALSECLSVEGLGPDHFDKRAQGKQVHRLIDRLRNLEFAVQITPVEAAA